MPLRNQAVTVNLVCWDTVNNIGKTGDAANITVRGSRDGTLFTPSAPSITQMDATNMPGVYKVSLTASENDGAFVTLGGISSTASCVIIPISWANELTGDAFSRLGAPAGASVSADIATRSTYAGGDTAGTTTLLSRIASALTISSGKVTVGTNDDKTGYSLATAPPTAAAIRTEMDNNSTKLANLDAAISTRLSTAGYTAPDNAGITAIKAKTDNLPASPAAVGSAMILTAAYDAAKTAAPVVADIADAVWDEMVSGHLVSGSTGNALNAAGASGDPWTTSLPGAYGSGTAGKIVGDNINASISSRSSHSAADVWAVTTRTLSSFGSLVSDVATAVWAAGTRTLTAIADSSGITTLLSRISAALTITGGNVTVGTNNDKTGYSLATAPPTTAQIRTELATELGRIDVAVSTRLATAGYTAPDNDGIALIQNKTDSLPVDPASQSAVDASISDVLGGLWGVSVDDLTTEGSIGQRLAAYFATTAEPAPDLSVSALTLCNNALLMLGNSPINGLDDGTKAANLCLHFYHQAVDSVLGAYTWNQAMARSEALSESETVPAFGYSNRYDLPGDCLRVVSLSEEKTPFRIEGKTLLCNESEAKILYIKRIAAADMGMQLSEVVSLKLAAMLAFPLTNSVSVADAMFKLYKDKQLDAQTNDAFEGTAPQMASDDWINTRY